jgi:rhodanese-related sulfurtransferase
MNTISPRQLHELHEHGQAATLLDVRTPAEFRQVHVPYAINAPLESLDPAVVLHSPGGCADQPLYVICHSGGRGSKACAKLLAAGVGHVVNVEGGTAAWQQAGLPVVRGKKTISLERQVRIAAGLLVLVGSALGYFVDPYWIGLAAFVGAGLTFAGVTDTCGMGMLLARMPWNQVDESTVGGGDSTVGGGDSTVGGDDSTVGGVSDADSVVSLKKSSASESLLKNVLQPTSACCKE